MKRLPFIVLCFVLVTFSPFGDSVLGDKNPQVGRDVFCGARCVRYVLSHYGHEVDLIDIVKELQWPHLERPVSLHQLMEFLEERGIYTHACRVGIGVDLVGDEPAIVHLRQTDGSDGHFVVWISGSNGRAEITDGLRAPWAISNDDLAIARSGNLILTSKSAIPDPRSRFLFSRYRSLFNCPPEMCGLAFGVVVFCLGYYVYRRRVK